MARDRTRPYETGSLATEGFIHCTDGVDAPGVTFDRYYAADAQPFLALTLELDALDSPWRYDVPGSPYPHIHGPVRPEAVVGASRVDRAGDGRFTGLTAI
jgi:uncharacterized protein (DUF952 family)